MDLKRVKDLIKLLDKKDLSRIRIKEGELEIEIERSLNSKPYYNEPPVVQHQVVEAVKEKNDEKEGLYIDSPMVGSFYRSSSPESAPFVAVGDRVNPDTVICIIEAMKVMNEVKAGISGKIEEILVDDGQPVEFGTKLFKISS